QEASVGKTIEAFGQLDVLIANAGVGHFAPIESLELDQWKQTIDINLTGVFYSVKAAVPAIKKSQGYIITIASLAGTNFFAAGAAYNASKFGLVGFTQAIMLDLRQFGVKVTTIMPGSVSTYFNGRTPSDTDAWKIQPEDLGQITTDLLKMHPRTLPSKVEVRPSMPPKK
ncbi:MAG: SDR family oxidoreductase, partial [Bacteroidota bacterium]